MFHGWCNIENEDKRVEILFYPVKGKQCYQKTQREGDKFSYTSTPGTYSKQCFNQMYGKILYLSQ
jgi:hypothetical protein